MAAQGQDVLLSVAADTRQFEKDIQRAASRISLDLNTKGFSQPLGKISGQLGEFEKSLAASNARVIAFGASAGAIYAVQKALDETFKSFVNVEKTLIEINSILNVNSSSLKKFGNDLFDVAKNTGQGFDTVSKSALEFSRQGLSVEDTLKRTNDALILTRLSGLDVVSSTEAITAALNSFNLSAESSSSLINKLVAVDQSFSVSSADLAEAIKRVGSSAQDAGVSLDQLIAIVTAAQQTTSRGGAVIGNSLKTIFTRLQRPEVLDALDQLGVKTRDAEGNIAPLIQILSQLSSVYQTLGGTQKSQIAELVGGVFQINILKASLADLSKEYSVYNQALGTSKNASDEAISRNEQLNQSFASLLSRTISNFQNAAAEIGGSSLGPAARKALEGLNSALGSFNSDSQSDGVGAKIGEGIAKGIGSFLSGPGIVLATVGLYKIFERLTKFSVDAFKSLSGINANSSAQQQLQGQILSLISKNPKIIESINSGTIKTAEVHNQILALIQKETEAMQKQIAVAQTLTQSLSRAGVVVGQSGALKGIATTNYTKNRSYGFIPNFSAEQNEMFGAIAGGYKPGKVKNINIPGEGKNIYNTAESVVKFPGFSQPAIIPPKNSLAGDQYKKDFINRNGFDPYRSHGYIPNFSAEAPYKKSMSGLSEAISSMKTAPKIEGNNYTNIPGFEKTKDFPGVPKSQANAILNSKKFQQGKAAPQKTIESDISMLVLGGGESKGGYTFNARPEISLPRTDVVFPVIGYRDSKKKEALEEQIKNFVKNEIEKFSAELDVNPPVKKTDISSAMETTKGLLGSIGSQSGSIFEATFRSSFGKQVRDAATQEEVQKYGTFDIIKTPSGLKEFFPGLTTGKSADFKSSPSGENREDMALKILKAKGHSDLISKIESSKGKNKTKSSGFIPNFSAVDDAMKREKKTSGANPQLLWSNTLGMPVVVNDAQTAEYGKNADKIIRNDHIGQGQYASKNNLMKTGSGSEKYKSFGHIPNFASPEIDLSSTAEKLKNTIENLASTIKNVVLNMAQNNSNLQEQKKQAQASGSQNLNPKYSNLDKSDIKEVLDAKKMGLSGLNNAIRNAEESLSQVSISTKTVSQVLNKVSLKYSLSASESDALAREMGSFGSILRIAKNKVNKNFDDNNLGSGLKSFKQNAIFASFGMSMVGGLLESFAGDNKSASKAIQGLTQGLSTGATVMGLIPGKAGLVIGGLVGLAAGANALGRLFTDKAPDLEKKLEDIKKTSSNFSSSSQRYLQARQKVDDAYSNPEKVSSVDLQKMNQELIDSMLELPVANRAYLMSIIDGTKLQEEVNRVQGEYATQQKNLEFVTKGQGKLDDYNSVFGNLTKSFKTLFLDAAPFRSNADEVRDKRGLVYENKFELQNASKNLIDSLSKEGKKSFLDLGKNPNGLENFQKADKSTFISMLKNMGMNSNSTSLLSGLNTTEIKNLQASLSTMARENALSAKIQEATSGSRKEYAEALEQEKMKLKEAENSVKEFEKSLSLISQNAMDYGLFSSKFKNTQEAGNRDVDLQRASGMINSQKSYMTESGVANLDYLFNQAKTKNDFAKDTAAVNDTARESLLSAGAKIAEEIRKKNESKQTNVSEGQIIDFESALAKIANSNISPAEMKNAISSAYKQNLFRKGNEGESDRFGRDLNGSMDKQSMALMELNQKQDINNLLAKAQLDATLKQIDKDINIKSMGGFQGFLSNDREDRLRSIEESSLNLRGLKSQRQKDSELAKSISFDQEDERRKQNAFEAARSKAQMQGKNSFNYSYQPVDRGERFQNNNSSVDRGRAAAKLALETLTAMGGVKPGEEKLYESLKNTAARGRASDLKEQARFIASELRSVGQVGLANAIQKRDWNQTSRDQIDEAIKTQNASMALVTNTNSLVGDVKTIASLLNQSDRSVNKSINENGINQSLQEGSKMLSPGYFDNLIKNAINQLNQSKNNESSVRAESEIKQRILESESQKINLAEEARQRTKMDPVFLGNLDISKVDPEIIDYITKKIEDAKSKKLSVPDLTDLATEAKSKNINGADQLLEASNNAASYQGQAIKEYVENLQRLQAVQILQKQQTDKVLQDQQELQNLTGKSQMQSDSMSTSQPNPTSQTSSNIQNSGTGSISVPQGNVVIPQATVNLNGNINAAGVNPNQLNPIIQPPPQTNQAANQNTSDFDPRKIGEIIAQAMQKMNGAGPNKDLQTLASTFQNSFKTVSESIGSLNSSISSLNQSMDSNKEGLSGRVDVELSPMEVKGEIGMRLTSDPIKLEFDLSDLEALKTDVEKIFEEKFGESEQKLENELRRYIDSAVSRAVSSNGPRPPKYF